MSYSYNPNTAVGAVRMLTYDTDQTALMFQDEDIQAMLTLQDNDVFLAAGTLLMSFAAKMARQAKKKTAGKYSEDLTKVSSELRETAKVLLDRAQEPWDGVIEQTFENVEDISRRFEDSRSREFIIKQFILGALD